MIALPRRLVLRNRSQEKVLFCCPNCDARLLAAAGHASIAGTCPSCGGWIRSPEKMPLEPMKIESAEGKPTCGEVATKRYVTPAMMAKMGAVRRIRGAEESVPAGRHRRERHQLAPMIGAISAVLGLVILVVWRLLRG